MKAINRLRKKILLISVPLLIIAFAMGVTLVSAFFADTDTSEAPIELNVDALFGKLHPSAGPSGAWGTANNPYLISTAAHLKNLYALQNHKDIKAINENSVFQVSDQYGKPCFIGGESVDQPIEIPSIGSEDFPFISNLHGVVAQSEADFITLPGGEVSNISVIGNIRVIGYEGQVDIGLFGNVGKPAANKIGRIEDLLLYNIRIKTDAVGNLTKTDKLGNPVHGNYFTSETSHETNHIGILAGHAENCEVYNISVYYEQDSNGKARADAFDIDALTGAKYTTAGGIIGYYKNLWVSESEFPVSSDGLDTGQGGMTVGFGLGIMYSQDIWTFMEQNYFDGGPAPLNEYGMKDTFDHLFYGQNNTDKKYFQIGVFTFAHSNETITTDRVAKLWVAEDSNYWSISTSNSYQGQSVDFGINASKYYVQQVVYDQNVDNSNIRSGTLILNGISRSNVHYVHDFPTNLESPDWRFMIVVESGGVEYALVKYGAVAAAQRIDTSNFVIPDDQLPYYTFQVYTQRTQDLNYPPYTSQAAFRYHSPGYLVVSNNSSSNDNATRQQNFICYGRTYPESGGGIKRESVRPLRIYDTVSFMATSVTNYIEGVYFIRVGTGANTRFVLQRQGNNTSTNHSRRVLSNYLRFTDSDGFVSTTSQSDATQVKLYAVRVKPNASEPQQSPQQVAFNRQIYTPTQDVKTYDMSKTVLYYVGNSGSDVASQRYLYEMRSLESLGWADNNGDPIIEVHTAMKMADPTSYYYLNNVFWGVLQGIRSPKEMPPPFDTVIVPLASIGFTVQGHGIRNGPDQKAKVFVIVATEPSQLVDQTITISYFPYTTSPSNPAQGDFPNSISYDDNVSRQVEGSVPLPPVPGGTAATTQNIWVRDGGQTYTAYPNMNTVLVAFEFEVTVSRYPRTYYLEASKGSANFVYLSAERTASGDTNPDHENDAFLGLINGVDYVALGEGSTIATVGSEAYVKSQLVPYFGLTANPANPKGENPNLDALLLKAARYFTYNISRFYDSENKLFTTNIYVNVKDSPPTATQAQLKQIMEDMNFNFVEWSYLDYVQYRRIYSDVVNTTINNRSVNWKELYG